MHYMSIWDSVCVIIYHISRLYTCKGTGGAHGPAGAAVLRDMLIACHTHIVYPINVAPIPGSRELSDVQVLMRSRIGSENIIKMHFNATYPAT